MLEKKWNTDRILSLCAIFIGVATLVVYTIQTSILIEQKHAGVWPEIELSGSNWAGKDFTKNRFKINITNKGIGPALIKKVKIYFRDSVYSDYSDVFRTIYGNNFSYVSSSVVGRTLLTGETVNPLELSESVEGRQFANVFYNRDSLRAEIFYKSIYGKCYVSRGFETEELKDCKELD